MALMMRHSRRSVTVGLRPLLRGWSDHAQIGAVILSPISANGHSIDQLLGRFILHVVG
jgi:hypothetical protein